MNVELKNVDVLLKANYNREDLTGDNINNYYEVTKLLTHIIKVNEYNKEDRETSVNYDSISKEVMVYEKVDKVKINILDKLNLFYDSKCRI